MPTGVTGICRSRPWRKKIDDCPKHPEPLTCLGAGQRGANVVRLEHSSGYDKTSV